MASFHCRGKGLKCRRRLANAGRLSGAGHASGLREVPARMGGLRKSIARTAGQAGGVGVHRSEGGVRAPSSRVGPALLRRFFGQAVARFAVVLGEAWILVDMGADSAPCCSTAVRAVASLASRVRWPIWATAGSLVILGRHSMAMSLP